MIAINFSMVAGCVIWMWRYRKTVQVSVAQPFFLGLVLLGCLVSTSTIFALGVEDEGNGTVPACMTIPWLYSVGFSITFGKQNMTVEFQIPGFQFANVLPFRPFARHFVCKN